MKNGSAIAMCCVVDILISLQTSNDNWNFMLTANFIIVLKAVIRRMTNLINGKRGYLFIWVIFLVLLQFEFYSDYPFSSSSAGRALSAGKDPTIPALHCAITRSGPDTMNKGAPTIGISKFCKIGGNDII